MANLSNLKPWPKGVSGNPAGRYVCPKELQGIRSLTQIETTKIISKYARMTLEELGIAEADKKTPILELNIIHFLKKSIDDGDYKRIAFLLERCIGKIPDIIEDDEDRAAREELSKIPLKELALLVLKNNEEEK